MPIGFKSAANIVAEIEMMRTIGDSAFLVLEGPDDMRFWRPRKHQACEIVDGEGKGNVQGAMLRVEVKRIGGVLGIVDEDYDLLDGEDLVSSNLVAICPHDLECLLCQSPALDRVLSEYGDVSKISDFEEREGRDVRAALLSRARVFGNFRWAAKRCGVEIGAEAIRIRRFVKETTWEVDQNGLMRAVTASCERELTDCISNLPAVDPWRVVRGHDALEILRIGLTRVLGNLKASVGPKEISRVLRAGGELSDTSLWRSIRSWERDNFPYLILR